MSGQLALKPLPAAASTADSDTDPSFQEIGVAPGAAPWVSGRVGIAGSNEAGLSYLGRALRVDVRHAFTFGKAALSVGLGASAVMARRPGESHDVRGVFGGGGDLPVLIGLRSASDLYALWFGPRAGFEVLSGRLQLGPEAAPSIYDVSARHFYGSLVAGLRVGFRHVHAAIELDAGYHDVNGTFTTSGVVTAARIKQITLTPAGALLVSF